MAANAPPFSASATRNNVPSVVVPQQAMANTSNSRTRKRWRPPRGSSSRSAVAERASSSLGRIRRCSA
jgi:hypothetical protein